MSELTIACVLRSGGDYGPEWVQALGSGVHRASPGVHFECLTNRDIVSVGRAIPFTQLRHGWPGWWSKIEIFRPGLFRPDDLVLYVDLDTLVVGDLTPFFEYSGELAMLSDFGRPRRAQSGVMLFRPGAETERIYREFMRSPAQHMRRHRGDGEWLDTHANPDRLQDLFPGKIVSFKKHCRKAPPKTPPEGDVRIVCFHGRPRPNAQAAGWGHEAWKAQLDRVQAT